MIAEIGTSTYTSIEFKAVSNQFIIKRGSTIFFELCYKFFCNENR